MTYKDFITNKVNLPQQQNITANIKNRVCR